MQKNSSTLIRRAVSPADILSIQRLRYEVWHAEGAVINDPEQRRIADDHDSHGLHWGVYVDETLVAAARLCLHERVEEAPDAFMFKAVRMPTPVASLNRLVVLKSYRGRGIARTLDELRIAEGKQSGARAVIATPKDAESRRTSLRTLGFQFPIVETGRPIWSSSVPMCAAYLIL